MKGLQEVNLATQMKALATTGKSFKNLRTDANGQTGRKDLVEASQDFEALFVRQLLAVMRRSVPDGNPELKAAGSDLFQGMMDDAFADQIARSGRGLGLAEMLLKQFENTEEASADGFSND